MNDRDFSNKIRSAFADTLPSEELAERVMNTEQRPVMKKLPSKALTAVLAAAASLSVLTVSVGAANNWDYAGIFRSIFGDKSENIAENIVPVATVLSDEIDTMNFELAAVAADKHGVLAIMDVYSENGYKLIEETDGICHIKPIEELYFDIYTNNTEGSATSVTLLEHNEEKVRLAIRMNTNAVIKDERIPIAIMRRDTGDNFIHDTMNYVWSAEFTASYSGEEIRCEKNTALEGTDFKGNTINATLMDVEISPISAYLEIDSFDNFYDAFYNANESYALLDSGEKVRIIFTASVTDMSSFTFESDSTPGTTFISLGFEKPVNPSDVCTLVIAGQIVELK